MSCSFSALCDLTASSRVPSPAFIASMALILMLMITCCNWLIDFVRQGGRQLSHGGDTANVREVRLRLTQSLFGLLALGDVGRTTHELHQIPGRVQNRMSDSVEVSYLAIWKKKSELNFVIRFFTYCLIDCLLPLGSIVRMNAL